MKKNFLIILSTTFVILVSSLLSSFNIKTKYREKNEQVGDLYLTIKNGDLSGRITGEKTAYFEGKSIDIPDNILATQRPKVLSIASDERFIEVDLSEQKLRAWEGNKLFLESLVSTGLPWWPTPKGEFRIWIKIRATKMQGGSGRNYYYLPNVPYVMFFENSQVPGWRGYGLHGTYWHNDFGKPKSHGCVNLPTPIAERLYYWTLPFVPEGKNVVRATRENPGTRIIIHD